MQENANSRRNEIWHLGLEGLFLVLAIGFLIADSLVLARIFFTGFSDELLVTAFGWTIAWMLCARIAMLEGMVVKLLQERRIPTSPHNRQE